MRISNPFFIGFCITLFIVLNIFIIPQQKKKQRQVDKKAIWTIESDEEILSMLVTPYNLIQLVDNEPIFQLKTFNKATGEVMGLVSFTDEIGAAEKVIYTDDAIYLVFANGNIYQLDAQTLFTNWKVKVDLKLYDARNIQIEQVKDLLLVSTSNSYNHFYFFLQTTTGDSVHYTYKTYDAASSEPLPVFFDSEEQGSWERYYNFKEHHLIFDQITSDCLYTGQELITNLSDSLKIISFDLDELEYQKIYKRYTTNTPFSTRQKKLDLSKNIIEYYDKEITHAEIGPKCTVFCFDKINRRNIYRSVPTVDYSFLKSGDQSASLSLQNIHQDAIECISNDYFITLRGDHPNHNQSHIEIIMIDLNDLSFKKPFYVPTEQRITKVLCDKEQVYLFLKNGENNRVYCSALSINS